MENVEELVCTVCGEVRPVGEFRRDRSRKAGFRLTCRPCRNEADRRRSYLAKGLSEWGLPVVSDEDRAAVRAAARARRAREAALPLYDPNAPLPPNFAEKVKEDEQRAPASPPPVTPKKHQPKPKPKSKLSVW